MKTIPGRLRGRGLLVGIPTGAVAVALITLVIALVHRWVPVLSLGVLYVFAVLPVAVVWGLPLAAAVSVASMLAFNWFFLPPTHTFSLAQSENWFALAVYLATAIAVSELATRTRRLARSAVEAQALRESDTVKTAILRAVGHDLRSPLTAIRAASDGLASQALDLTGPDRRALLETIRVEARRLERLVANLLDLSRLEAGALHGQPQLWTVDAVVGQALEQLGADAARVVVAVTDEPPLLRIDAPQVERILVNLLENALAVTPSGQLVELVAVAGDLSIRLEVRDRGPGVPPPDRERIFRPFERGAGAVGGTGLGLAIARGFAEANGGRIWAEGRGGQGATFVLELPAAQLVAPARG